MSTLALQSPADASRRTSTFIALAVVYLVWSSTYLALRHVVVALPPMLAGAARFAAAGVILFAVQRARGDALPTWRSWRAAALSGTLLFACGNGIVGLAETRVGSGVAAVACASTPLFVAAYSAAWGERPSPRELTGVLLGLVGVVVLGLSADLASAGARGMLLLASPAAWALGTVLARRARPASPTTFAAQQMVCGAAAMFVAAMVLGERAPTEVPVDALVALAYLVLFGSVVAFPAYAFLVKHARPAVATSYAYVNPVLAVILGSVFGAESLTPSTLAALALVVAAVVIVATGKPKA
jgi:drug/metabolite transporter (DMT)-like permease